MVLCMGDNLNLSVAEQGDDALVATAEGEFGHIIACLENIVCSVVYIPGNVGAAAPRAGCCRSGDVVASAPAFVSVCGMVSECVRVFFVSSTTL